MKEQAAAGADIAAVVEKGKSAFVGPELYRKTLGVIGLGAIGALVANDALKLGMDVYGYDPYLSVEAALRLDRHVHVVKDVTELFKVCDYITLHIPYLPSTKDFINAEAISKMKGDVRILNLARGELVCDDLWGTRGVIGDENSREVALTNVHERLCGMRNGFFSSIQNSV